MMTNEPSIRSSLERKACACTAMHVSMNSHSAGLIGWCKLFLLSTAAAVVMIMV